MKIPRSPYFIWPLLSSAVFLLVLGLRYSGLLQFLELNAYDQFIRLHQRATPVDPRIVLVSITEQDIRDYGHPISDETMTAVLDHLIKSGARTIGVDIYRDLPVAPGHEEFKQLLINNSNIFWIMQFPLPGSDGVPPPPVLENSERVGFNDIPQDPGGVVRRAFLFLDDGNALFAYSFPLLITLHYLRDEGLGLQASEVNRDYVRLGETTIPYLNANDGSYIDIDNSGYQFLLDFEGLANDFPTVSIGEILSEDPPVDIFNDKIVLLGTMAASIKDSFFTPFSLGQDENQLTYGIALHGSITSQLLRLAEGESVLTRSPSESLEIFWIGAWALLGGFLGIWARTFWQFMLAAVGGLLALSIACYLPLLYGWWIPLVPSALAWVIAAGVMSAYMSNQEKSERALLMQLFSKHVSSDVAELMWEQREMILKQGRLQPSRLTATVLFTDLVGFTSVSEKMDPQELMDWLNEYMDTMSQQILLHRGVIDKFIGDAIMAVFGIPLPRTRREEVARDAVNAVNCALVMNQQLQKLNDAWRAQGLPMVGMRIGIYTGPLVAGGLGSGQRSEYTVIGDTVNTASRLESFDKTVTAPDMPCRILIGESTLGYLDDAFITVKVGEVNLKGKDSAVTVYMITGLAHAHSSEAPAVAAR